MAESSEIANSLVPVGRRQAMVLLEAGYLWLDMGHFDKARDIFAGAAALMPKSEVPQLGLGALEFAQGRHDKALQAYRSAQRLAPQSALPRAHAGEALLFMGKVPEALKELKAAMDLEPDGDGAKLAQSLIQAKEAGVLPPAKK
ncbi:tetratricopeptide repeat protein [Pyxidicoccus caerfyrddinensis]|uniref:tetratricopeptide repeat protein n=1 Tax=Pyxidicoccus caerfyrddinensis TaxID=2709663 RepID=UPI0013DBEF69|nr:tetratricopeptide repeat protein [Pyxidicoccus caerfyrddinensis]